MFTEVVLWRLIEDTTAMEFSFVFQESIVEIRRDISYRRSFEIS